MQMKKKMGRPCTHASGRPAIPLTHKIDPVLAEEWKTLTALVGDCRSTLIEGWIRRYVRKHRRKAGKPLVEIL